MTRQPRLLLLSLLALVLALVGTVPATAAPRADDVEEPGSVARRHLAADASGSLRLERDADGRLRFVGARAGTRIENPRVSPGSSVASAARAHLDRYGASLGAAAGTTFVRRTAVRAVSGVDSVTFTQEVGGVPVVGGDVVVSMGQDRTLRSLATSASTSGSAPVSEPATVSREAAGRSARALVGRATGAKDLGLTDDGRWVLAPDVVDVPGLTGARTVWRFEVGDGAAVRHLVLVDDHSGQVLLHSNLVAHADRVVCDRAGVRGSDSACTSGFARTEGSPESLVTDVNDAYALSGVVSDFYQQVAATDLTSLLGVLVGGVPKLASTVRFCPTTDQGDCPYDNAFWNGEQMFYGTGWAGADDVVGHEMTHGFVDRHSALFYWGQSGAINESVADVIGEIVDHRNAGPGDSATDWRVGEDSPVGTLRSLADPTAYGQPDRTTSSLYTADTTYADAGGVHTNSGVGNKTAYLISQGGAFNGQTITGIDGGDAGLTKTAKLFVDVIERLTSGADYAALALQLDQSCQDLRTSAGFTAADCTAVHQAGIATQLATTPTNAAQPADASAACPAGTARRVLFDSETGDPATKFVPQAGWARATAPGVRNATSGTASWFAENPATTQTNTLRTAADIAVPVGQATYLGFQGWYLLDHEGVDYYDGGTVEIAANGGAAVTPNTTWVNGPARTLTSLFSNPNGGRKAFAGDSRGWVGSRLDLSSYAGSTIRPQFTMRSDSDFAFIGWYLDDVSVYTCDPVVMTAPTAVRAIGSLNGVTITWGPPAQDADQVASYQVSTPSGTKTLPATARSLMVAPISLQIAAFQVQVVAVPVEGAPTYSPYVTVRTAVPTIRARRTDARLRFKGYVGAGRPVAGGVVRIQRRTSTGWTTVSTVRTRSDGTYVATVKRRKRAIYRAAFMGSVGVVGRISVSRRW